jgi:hypothetical protein
MNALTLAAYRGNLHKLIQLINRKKGAKRIDLINHQNEFGCKFICLYLHNFFPTSQTLLFTTNYPYICLSIYLSIYIFL